MASHSYSSTRARAKPYLRWRVLHSAISMRAHPGRGHEWMPMRNSAANARMRLKVLQKVMAFRHVVCKRARARKGLKGMALLNPSGKRVCVSEMVPGSSAPSHPTAFSFNSPAWPPRSASARRVATRRCCCRGRRGNVKVVVSFYLHHTIQWHT